MVESLSRSWKMPDQFLATTLQLKKRLTVNPEGAVSLSMCFFCCVSSFSTRGKVYDAIKKQKDSLTARVDLCSSFYCYTGGAFYCLVKSSRNAFIVVKTQ